MTDAYENVYAVILAGGSGTRFWPKSRKKTPKQLCSIGDSTSTMLEITLDRLDGFIPIERRIIITHQEQAFLTRKIAGSKYNTLIAEPEAKNTAAALALASLEVQKISQKPDPIMVSLHADCAIENVEKFLASVKEAITIAKQGYLTLMGIVPQYPETGYGYIEKGDIISNEQVYAWKVKSFREKPDLTTAKEFLDCGNFYWNSGLFVWKVSSILEEFSKYLPNTLKALNQALKQENRPFSKIETAVLNKYYSDLEQISIDDAILEKSDKVAVIDANFGWQDVGSWAALDKCFKPDNKGNLVYGNAVMIDSQNTTIDSDGPFVATIGLKDMVVVHARNCILVCPKDRAQDVKLIVEHLKKNGKKKILFRAC
ncbi:MAG: sugar phosphate nucleotidyltransferase [Bdellovibrionota bacterium]